MIPFHFYQEIDTRHITRGNAKQQISIKGNVTMSKKTTYLPLGPTINTTFRILILETLAKKQNKTKLICMTLTTAVPFATAKA